MAHAWFGCDLALSGNLDRAAEHLTIVIALYDPDRQAGSTWTRAWVR